jgi:hypothetical protein
MMTFVKWFRSLKSILLINLQADEIAAAKSTTGI